MKIIFIDYSEIYYSTVVGTDVPDRREGKFVQIKKDTTEYLIFSPKEFSRYHADIVERFCTESGIAGFYNNAHKRFDILEAGWVVIGGGKYEIVGAKKYICLYDHSMAYGRFDTKGLKKKILSLNGFSNYTVQIE